MRKLVIGIGLVLAMVLMAVPVQAALNPAATVVLTLNVTDPITGLPTTTVNQGQTVNFEVRAAISGNTYAVQNTIVQNVTLGLESLALDVVTSAGGIVTVPHDAIVASRPGVFYNASAAPVDNQIGGDWGGSFQQASYIGTEAQGLGIQQFLVSENPVTGNQISGPADSNINAIFKRARSVNPSGSDSQLLLTGTLEGLSAGTVTLTLRPSTPTTVVAWWASSPTPVATANRMTVNTDAGNIAPANITNGTATLTVLAIPEPATIGLLAVSGLLMLWRRR